MTSNHRFNDVPYSYKKYYSLWKNSPVEDNSIETFCTRPATNKNFLTIVRQIKLSKAGQ